MPQRKKPYVHPSVNTPQVADYAAQAAARREERASALPDKIRNGLPKYTTPVSGGETPHMPALEEKARQGVPMAAQATATRARDDQRAVASAMNIHQQNAGSIISSDPGSMPATRAVPEPPLLLQPADVLPDHAARDPQFHQGVGSMLAQFQPHLAKKYGVVRQGRLVSPAELMGSPQTATRRPIQETIQDMQAAVNASASQPKVQVEDYGPPPPASMPKTDAEADEQARSGPGGAAARTGTPAIDIPDDEEAVQEALNEMDDMELDSFRRAMLRDIIKNPSQKEAIEKRLTAFGPEALAELLETNRLRQRVPIVPNVFEPTFQTMDQDVEFHLKQLLMLESKSINVTNAYLLDKYAVMTTTAGTVAINGNPLPTMLDSEGNFNDDLFWRKFNWLTKKPLHMLASLGIHYAWFEERVRRLFKVDEIKNG